MKPRELYEQLYCARGEMENRIKEQMSLFAGRMSAETMRANQLRLYLSAAAYVLMEAFRGLALTGTGMARAQVSTIRLRLLKIGARIRFSARRVLVSMSGGYVWQGLFIRAWAAMRCRGLKPVRQTNNLTIPNSGGLGALRLKLLRAPHSDGQSPGSVTHQRPSWRSHCSHRHELSRQINFIVPPAVVMKHPG